jgi:hypothetical protein
METNYAPAIAGLITLIVVFTGMVAYLLSRPSDLPAKS